MSLAELLLDQWADDPVRGTGFVHRHRADAVPAQRAPLPAWLPAPVAAALQARGIDGLYTHQAEALEHLRAGHDVVVATPTASGKSLVYHLAALTACHADEAARALYLFPTKALAHDQVVGLDALARAAGLAVGAHTFDGDTPADARRAIRQAARIVVTNPDMLHLGILPHHDRWAGLFGGLKLVVLDEAHTYRGVFGSHVANVIRRLRRICRHHGGDPRFVLSTATIANPGEHAEALIEAPVRVVDRSGAPAGRRSFYFFNPPLVDGTTGVRQSYVQAARKVARTLTRRGVPTIVFANSRLNVERLTRHLKEDVAQDGGDPESVTGYRGGYLPEHRRAIEAGLRSGRLSLVVATNALELGVDIGQLGACVLAGYPGTIASTLQRAGRAGRRDEPAVVVLVARSEPLDQYLMTHPEHLVDRSPEHARLQADHLLIVADHLKCAAFELPFAHDEGFGRYAAANAQEILGWLADERLLHPGAHRWQWVGEPFPAQKVALRALAEGNFTVFDRVHAHTVIGEVDFHSAASTLHPQAIYIVGGQTWQVQQLDWPGRRAYVDPVHVDYYTDAMTFDGVKPLAVFDTRPWPPGPERPEAQSLSAESSGAETSEAETSEAETSEAETSEAETSEAEAPEAATSVPVCTVAHGEVQVFERVVGFKKIRFATGENVGYGEVDLPGNDLHTTALWLAFHPDLAARLGLSRMRLVDALDGLGTVLARVAAVHLMCDTRDLGCALSGIGEDGQPSPAELPTLFVYEKQPGGVGLHQALYRDFAHLLTAVDRLLGRCGCEDGCPACVGAPAPLVAASDQPRSRRAVGRLLTALRHGWPR